MSDEIKPPRNITGIAPPNPTRDTAARKKPRNAPVKRESQKRRQPPADDQSPHVDEYV